METNVVSCTPLQDVHVIQLSTHIRDLILLVLCCSCLKVKAKLIAVFLRQRLGKANKYRVKVQAKKALIDENIMIIILKVPDKYSSSGRRVSMNMKLNGSFVNVIALKSGKEVFAKWGLGFCVLPSIK